jgi:uncharacterized membrane protein HdeD (DUF308 family)
MTCQMCEHDWCWHCGMAYRSKWHKLFQPCCEILQFVPELQNKCKCPFFIVAFLAFLFYILFPAVYFLAGTFLTFVGTYEVMKNFIRNYGMRRQRKCFAQTARLLVYAFIYLVITPVVWAVIFVLACVFYVLSVLPIWLMFVITLFRIAYNWFPEGRI